MREDVVEVDTASARLRRMRQSVLTSARLLRDARPDGSFRTKWAMLTLTYAAVDGWSPRHVTELVKNIRDYLRRRGHAMRYVWVLELQKRGAPHYHLLLELPRGVTLPKPDKRGWWPHGYTKIEWARHPVGYMAKYASKGSGVHQFPKGARISGVGGLSDSMRRERRWWLSPSYVREAFGDEGNPFRRPGGGWIDRLTGEVLPSMWVVVSCRPGLVRLIPRAGLSQALQAALSANRGWRRGVATRGDVRL